MRPGRPPLRRVRLLPAPTALHAQPYALSGTGDRGDHDCLREAERDCSRQDGNDGTIYVLPLMLPSESGFEGIFSTDCVTYDWQSCDYMRFWLDAAMLSGWLQVLAVDNASTTSPTFNAVLEIKSTACHSLDGGSVCRFCEAGISAEQAAGDALAAARVPLALGRLGSSNIAVPHVLPTCMTCRRHRCNLAACR
eukprot:COSAG05_NODE_1709_length_4237_cov_14.296762_4_plen_194_part_00